MLFMFVLGVLIGVVVGSIMTSKIEKLEGKLDTLCPHGYLWDECPDPDCEY